MVAYLQNNSAGRALNIAVSAGVFLFFALMLSVPRAYTGGAFILLVAGFAGLALHRSYDLAREELVMLGLLLAMFVLAVFGWQYHGNALRTLDLASRYLLVIPVFLVMLRYPPRLQWLCAGWVVGSLSAAGLAWWQTSQLGMERAVGSTGVIQFGDLGLMMGVFCAAGLFWTGGQAGVRALAWRLALVAGALAGIYISIASGSRGGWVALPFIALPFCMVLVNCNNYAKVLAAVLVVLVAGGVVASKVPSIQDRYHMVLSDLDHYQRGDADTSIGARLAIWSASARLIAQKPLLGWSQKEYAAQLQLMVDRQQADPIVVELANTHNNYLEIWVLQGIFALLISIALLVYPLWYFARHLRSPTAASRAVAVCGCALVIGYGVFCMTQIMLGRNNTLLFYLISLVSLWAAQKHQHEALNK